MEKTTFPAGEERARFSIGRERVVRRVMSDGGVHEITEAVVRRG